MVKLASYFWLAVKTKHPRNPRATTAKRIKGDQHKTETVAECPVWQISIKWKRWILKNVNLRIKFLRFELFSVFSPFHSSKFTTFWSSEKSQFLFVNAPSTTLSPLLNGTGCSLCLPLVLDYSRRLLYLTQCHSPKPVCFNYRREVGQCRICWFTATPTTDFQVSGTTRLVSKI